MVSGSPGPSRSLHRVSPNRFEGFGALALVCFVAARRSHGLRPSLARGADALGLVCVVIVPSRCSDCSVHPTLSSRSDGCPPSWFVRSAGRLSRSSFQRPPLHCLGSRGVRVPRRCRHLRFGAGLPPASRAAFVVSHHRGGFLLLDPARVLHRTSSHGVRDVSSLRQRVPITRFYPSKPFSAQAAGTVRFSP